MICQYYSLAVTKQRPIGLTGGANLYAYVVNNPFNHRDPSGLLVQAWYTKATQKLTICDRDTGERVSIDAESGGNPYGDPIPDGYYEILEQARRADFFRLDSVDGTPRDDQDDRTGRDHFRLHRPGRTVGCIAARRWDEWAKARDLILRTRTQMVTDNFQPWWRLWGEPRMITKYGELMVN